MQTHVFLVSRDVIFYKDTFPYNKGNEASISSVTMFHDEVQTEIEHPNNVLNEEHESTMKENLQVPVERESLQNSGSIYGRSHARHRRSKS